MLRFIIQILVKTKQSYHVKQQKKKRTQRYDHQENQTGKKLEKDLT